MNAYEFAAGFKGMNRIQVDGSDFERSFLVMKEVCEFVRKERKPYLVHAIVPLLGHHTSGVRKEFYRTDEDFTPFAITILQNLKIHWIIFLIKKLNIKTCFNFEVIRP